MREFSYHALPGRIVFGAGAARSALAEEIERLHVERVLLITTANREGLARRLAEPLGNRLVGLFTGAQTHVSPRVATAARELASASRADSVVSLGGGAATGTAKAVALTSGLPIVAVPTTYAGSEVTPVWGLTENGRKATGTHPNVLPRCVIYDPELTLTLPPAVSASSALNAMAHSLEAFWAPGRNPVSSLLAEESVRVLTTRLPTLFTSPRDLEARSDVLYAAFLAGQAFAATGSGLHHKICHVLGGAYGLPHALTHAVMLPYVLAFNAAGAPETMRRIGTAMGADDPVAALVSLTRNLELPPGLQALGMQEDQISEAARLVEGVAPTDNPGPVDAASLTRLIRAAWSGADPKSAADPAL